MSDRDDFRDWFSQLDPQPRYFGPEELLVKVGVSRGGATNSFPPESKWDNIVPTIRVLDLVRHWLGAPVVLHSVWRDEGYNAAVGGVPGSQHKQFRAIDFSSPKGDPRDWASMCIHALGKRLPEGGVGLYDTFVHVDTRGSEALWNWANVSTTSELKSKFGVQPSLTSVYEDSGVTAVNTDGEGGEAEAEAEEPEAWLSTAIWQDWEYLSWAFTDLHGDPDNTIYDRFEATFEKHARRLAQVDEAVELLKQIKVGQRPKVREDIDKALDLLEVDGDG